MSAALDAALAGVDEVGPLAAKLADDSERQGHLHDDVVDAFHETGLWRILVPTELGGGGLTIPESVQVYRAMSAHDGSAGWLAGIIGNGPLFGNFVGRAVFEEVYGPARSVVAGSLNPLGGQADPVPGGFRFNGRATNVSGCHEASWIMAGAWIHRDGAKSWVDGRPEMVAGIIPISSVSVQDTWSTTGMRATGSDDCTYVDVFVPTERTFTWPEPAPCWDAGPASHMPMHAQLGIGVAATVIGIARGTQDHFVELALSKRPAANSTVLADRSFAHMALGEAAGLVRVAEDALRSGTADLWARAERRDPIDEPVRLDLRLRMVSAARLAVRAIDLLHDAAGMSGVRVPSALERGWRDAHTAVQHVLLSTGRLEVAGRMLLGRDPESPVI